ncbi:NADPH-dependent 2,4-dienoyl-CoA reductase/sulfur reductase-like enzyme/rhodanese-related sulfurtransferase [Microbacterium keratanolyticum]|uniref:CoA-disulfide reductase n=2 Tax=Microbacterium keratanolyticum TaxID=67574 RepID=A0A9W6HQN6_9MICO|nr:NADPH-dependent 2,4-dienoyl-CoA reductase/sulfur reductase-like enzyme/rhodanese-related sulfurtransferase [Microbacterium keratanolyticum]GLK00640.1 CoA-disulfide reductase [Microbacterium keratanolyticum]
MSKSMRVIIVGGVAGGMSAATRLRRLDENAEIIVIERGDYVSFANCGLPYYVGGVIPERESLLLQTPQSLRARFALDVRVGHEVTAIDREAQTVTVRDLRTGIDTVEHYDALILATGASSREIYPQVDGAAPVATLRTIDDVDRITAALDGLTGTGRAVVVGGGFIGLEAVENLAHRGLAVTLVQHGAHPLSPLDPEMASVVVDTLRSEDVDLRTRTTVTAIDADGVHLDDGTTLAADLVIDARGVQPAASVAAASGLRLGPTGGIAVDGHQRTSDPRIFAVGDAVEKIDQVSEEPTLVTMAGLANRHGRTIADVIAWESGLLDERPQDATPATGTAIVGVFGLAVAMTGWSEKRLRDAGWPHRVIHAHPVDHAAYYPGAERLTMKLLVDPDTDLILGAQVIGRAGADKRIDVIATAMQAGLTASQLARLELAYAPQYGSAKDPINMLGYIADNHASGTTDSIQWHELDAARDAGASVIDVRSASEYERGGIPGSLNISVDDLRSRIAELPEGELIVHCQVGQRGHTAVRILRQLGRDARNLDGGYLTWRAGTAMREPVLTP